MLTRIANALAEPPARIGYSIGLVVRGAAIAAGAAGATATAYGALAVLDRFAPLVLSGRSGDVTATVTDQLQALALVSVRLNELTQAVFTYFTS